MLNHPPPQPSEAYATDHNGRVPSPPGTLNLERLEQTRVALLDEIRSIEGQLSDPNRRDALGQRLPDDEYWAWRTRARHAWQAKQREYIELKRQIAETKRFSGHAPRLDAGDPEQLLGELHKLVKRWVAQDVVIPRPAERDLIDRVAARLGRGPLGDGDEPAA